MPNISQEFQNRLEKFLCSISALQEKGSRDILLRGFPQEPVRTIKRDDTPRSDLHNIIEAIASWKKLESGKPTLELLMDNAYSFVQGTGQGIELQKLKEEFCHPVRPGSPPISLPPAAVWFVNRDDELKIIRYRLSPRFIFVEAPVGYGKSYLLKEIKRRQEQEGDICSYVSFDEDVPRSVQGLVSVLIGQMTKSSKHKGANIAQSNAEQLVFSLADHINKHVKQQAFLLFDDVNQLDSFLWLRDDLVDNLDKSLTALGTQNKLRVVYAGNYMPSVWSNGAKYRIYPLSLRPFDEDVICQAIQTRYQEQSSDYMPADTCEAIARGVIGITGGHPKCIVNIINELSNVGFAASPEIYFSQERQRQLFDEYVAPVIASIVQPLGKAEEPFRTISIFRRFNPNILETLVAAGKISGFKDGVKLLHKLSALHLITSPKRDDPWWTDKLVRKMLTVEMRLKSPDKFLQLHQLAASIFRSWVEGKVGTDNVQQSQAQTYFIPGLQVFSITEYLYHFLSCKADKVTSEQTKRKVNTEFDECLSLLSHPVFGDAGKRDMAVQLKDMLESDIEIQRLAGPEAYDGLIRRLDGFISNLESKLSKEEKQ